ncbi:MAG TPA: MAB_1171c family putative transporter [Pseudonocardiaceae bacterium]|nr:MAB_1171c family putative transporter [Pseudonocardiaceae bacterium]
MGVSTLFLSTAIVPFLIAGYRGVLRGHGQRKPTDIPLIVTALAWGLALVTLAPTVQAFESTLVPSLGRLLSNVCTLVAAFGLLTLVSHISHVEDKVPSKVRVRLITLLIVVTVMAVMFFASRPPSGRGIFTGLYRSQPTLAVYTLVYATYLAYAVVDLAALALRSLRGARSWLRLGMILIVGGSVLYAGYLIQKVVSIVNELVSGSPAEPFCASAFATLDCAFAIAMPAYAVLLVILGTTVPTLGPWLEHLIRGIRHRRSLHRLRPLWEILHEAQPDITHATPVRPWSPSWPGHIAELLYRRVIAIRDGLLALQPYRDPTDTHEYRRQAAAGPSDRRRAAAIEAADIRAAVHRRQHNMAPREYVPGSNATIAQDDLDSEVRWLTLVSDALTRGEPPPIQS